VAAGALPAAAQTISVKGEGHRVPAASDRSDRAACAREAVPGSVCRSPSLPATLPFGSGNGWTQRIRAEETAQHCSPGKTPPGPEGIVSLPGRFWLWRPRYPGHSASGVTVGRKLCVLAFRPVCRCHNREWISVASARWGTPARLAGPRCIFAGGGREPELSATVGNWPHADWLGHRWSTVARPGYRPWLVAATPRIKCLNFIVLAVTASTEAESGCLGSNKHGRRTSGTGRELPVRSGSECLRGRARLRVSFSFPACHPSFRIRQWLDATHPR